MSERLVGSLIIVLGLIVVVSLASTVYLVSSGYDSPPGIIAIGASAAGGLVGVFVKSPLDRPPVGGTDAEDDGHGALAPPHTPTYRSPPEGLGR